MSLAPSPLAASRAVPATHRRLLWWFDGPVLGPIRRFSGAVMISVGPWIVAVVSLAVVSVTMTPLMGGAAVEELRLTVVYAFAVAPLIAGPVGTVAGRLVRQAVETRGGALVVELFVVATLGSGALAMAVALVVAALLDLQPQGLAWSFAYLTTAAALLWTTFALLAALRAYVFLITSFSTGMAIAVLCTLAAARSDPTLELLVWCFTAGIAVCVVLALAYVAEDYGADDGDIATAAFLLAGEMGRVWPLALGVFAAVAAVWTDKVVYWLGPEGMRSEAGFLHFAPYDSVMFVAHLSLIPTLAATLLFHDGPLTDAVESFRARLRARCNYAEVEAAAANLRRVVWSNLSAIVFVQAVSAAAMVLLSPWICTVMNFSVAQFYLLRVGIVAALLYSVLFLSSIVLMFCQRTNVFLIVQFTFLIFNAVFSILFHWWFGVTSFAFFFSALAAGIVCFLCAYDAISDYDYFVFVGENTSLYDRSGSEDRKGGPLFRAVRARTAAARRAFDAEVRRTQRSRGEAR